MCVHVHMCVEPVGGCCGGHRLSSDIIPQTLSILFSGTGSLAGLELTRQARPASLSPKAVPASAFPVQRSQDCAMTSSFCTWVLGLKPGSSQCWHGKHFTNQTTSPVPGNTFQSIHYNQTHDRILRKTNPHAIVSRTISSSGHCWYCFNDIMICT